MGFNRRKLVDQRREAANKEAANRHATEAQVLEDTERLIAAWNERQDKRMPMLFSPTSVLPSSPPSRLGRNPENLGVTMNAGKARRTLLCCELGCPIPRDRGSSPRAELRLIGTAVP